MKLENQDWFYTSKVKEHFLKPKNICKTEKEVEEFKEIANGYGEAGNFSCGDIMKFWIVVDPKTEKIKKCRWQTWGCASALASTSMLSVMITEKGGMKIVDALKIKPEDIANRLGGLPSIKFHCSILGDQALRKAIENYKLKKK